jgi:hypothetical protein
MVEKTAQDDRFDWRLPLYAVLGSFIIFIPVAIGEPDISLILYIFAVAPLISVVLLNSAIRKERRQRLSVLSMLAIYGAISVGLVANYSAVRTAARWFVWSHDYKAQVLAQPASAKGELKHIDWDGWGMLAQNTYVFLVFDPTDSLSLAAMTHQPGKFNGIPCEVLLVPRLESRWYSVRFYTGEYWGQRNALDRRPGCED